MYAIVDIETTGGNPKTARITEIAIVTHDGEKIIDTYSTLVNPQTPIAPFVIELTGITNEMVQNAPLFSEIAEEIDKLTANKIFVAHNSKCDYSFLGNEYRRLHRRFQRKHVCTVQMSQTFLPGYPSYSLSKLCKSLNIPLENKHRALDDTLATTKLFEIILKTAPKQQLNEFLQDEFTQAEFPNYINKNEINNLPEDVGVFYLLDKNQAPIYIHKSKNIRHRVISYYTKKHPNKREQQIIKNTHSVDFVITGSELIAELLEHTEVSTTRPKINAYRKRKYRYGLYTDVDNGGFLRIKTKQITRGNTPIIELTTKKIAENALTKIKKKYHLNQNTRLQTHAQQYNDVVQNALLTFHFEHANFIIIDEGRKHLEKAIVLIKDGKYYGYDFVEQEYLEHTRLHNIIDAIPKQDYSTEKQQIIRKYLRKKNKYRIIPLD